MLRYADTERDDYALDYGALKTIETTWKMGKCGRLLIVIGDRNDSTFFVYFFACFYFLFLFFSAFLLIYDYCTSL